MIMVAHTKRKKHGCIKHVVEPQSQEIDKKLEGMEEHEEYIRRNREIELFKDKKKM